MDIKMIDRTLGELDPGTLFALTPGKQPDHIRLLGYHGPHPYHASFEKGGIDGTKLATTPVYTARSKRSFGQLKSGDLFVADGRYAIKAQTSFCARGIHHREAYNAMTLDGDFVRHEDAEEVTPIKGPLEIKY
jgi:hypothetical protein